MKLTMNQLRAIIEEELKGLENIEEAQASTEKYDDDPALQGDQDELPDALQKGIIGAEDEEENSERTLEEVEGIIKQEILNIMDERQLDEILPALAAAGRAGAAGLGALGRGAAKAGKVAGKAAIHGIHAAGEVAKAVKSKFDDDDEEEEIDEIFGIGGDPSDEELAAKAQKIADLEDEEEEDARYKPATEKDIEHRRALAMKEKKETPK